MTIATYNYNYHNNCRHLITMDTEMNIENKNLKFSGACTHKLTCRWLAKRGIEIASEKRQRQLIQQRVTVLLILV